MMKRSKSLSTGAHRRVNYNSLGASRGAPQERGAQGPGRKELSKGRKRERRPWKKEKRRTLKRERIPDNRTWQRFTEDALPETATRASSQLSRSGRLQTLKNRVCSDKLRAGYREIWVALK
jgi:hypothetical protein